MTDTTLQVSPVSEGEMSQIQALFKKAADTIVAFSSLSEQVRVLQKQVDELQGTVNRYRNQIDTQDEALYKLRREREELVQEAAKSRQEANNAKHDAERLVNENTDLNLRVQDLDTRLADTRKERDEADYKVVELEDKVKALEGTLSKFRDLAKALMPEPEPTVTLPVQQNVTSFPYVAHEQPKEPEPEPTQEQVSRGW